MSRPFTLLIKPAGPDCNIACSYCFYSRKSAYFGGAKHRMSDEVLECLIKSYLGVGLEQNNLAWQGGEPTLMGLDFYKRAVELQEKYRGENQTVVHALQTNGILLNDEWTAFMAEHGFLAGISLDGPQDVHDHYRKDHGGHGTWERVMAGIESCQRQGAEFNILVLLNDVNVKRPDELFDFFVGQGYRYLQFIPCVEQSQEDASVAAPFSVTAEEYGAFMCRIFDRWVEYGAQKLSVRLFDSFLSYLVGNEHSECTFNQRCNDYIVIEHNGDAFCCDFFVTDEARLGNIVETPIEELANSDIKYNFGREKATIANKCMFCRYLKHCRGGCPKDRKMLGGTIKSPSYFCEAYKMFFGHALDRMQVIASDIVQGRYRNPD